MIYFSAAGRALEFELAGKYICCAGHYFLDPFVHLTAFSF